MMPSNTECRVKQTALRWNERGCRPPYPSTVVQQRQSEKTIGCHPTDVGESGLTVVVDDHTSIQEFKACKMLSNNANSDIIDRPGEIEPNYAGSAVSEV